MNSLQKKRGKLKIFLGAAAGVGKTFEMLSQGRQQQRQGRRVLVGIVETHGRAETESLLQGFEILPRRQISHRGIEVTELDLDQVLQRDVDLVLIDELAHTNAVGCRHEKRYQDVIEILDAGFDVYSTLNVQHVESRKELVEKIVGVTVGETVPDRILDLADSIELIDLPPQILIQRLEQGKVYDTEKVAIAKENFFKESTLTALRELALRLTAERVDHDLNTYRREKGILKPHKTNERLLVAIGPNPSSESLVRRGRQLAYNLEAAFIAVYVDRGIVLSPEDQVAVEKNIQLATALGATVFKISDSDVARAIMRISQDQQITQVIMGKPRKGMKGLYSSGEGLMKDLLENLSDVSLHLVETEASKRARFRSFLFDGNHSSLSDYLKAVLVSIGVVIVAYPFQEWVGYSAIGLFFLSVVMVLGFFVGRGPILAASVLTASFWNVFFIPPKYSFYITKLEDILLFFIFVVGAVVMGSLSARSAAKEKAYERKERQTKFLSDLSLNLARSDDISSLVEVIVKSISHLIAADIAIFIRDEKDQMKFMPESKSSWNPGPKEMSVAHYAFQKFIRTGKQSETLRDAEGYHLPMISASKVTGVLSIRPRQSLVLGADEIALLELVASTASIAVERALGQTEILELKALEHSEHLFRTIFSSLSHELRTPLTNLRGFLESLPSETNDVAESLESVARLDKLISNLLDTTRIDSGMLKARLEWTDPSDIIHAALNELKSEKWRQKFRINYSASLPLLKLDHGLATQSLFQILSNACIHAMSEDGFIISVIEHANSLVVTVEDFGPGIAEQDLKDVFSRFQAGRTVRTGGLGLGLSIAKTFAQAQGGDLIAKRKDAGGLCFELRFPIPEGAARVELG